MWLCLFPPAASRQRAHKKLLNYKQSVEIGHYGGGMLWMHCVPKSIRELLYLVRRSQGGVIKPVQGMRDTTNQICTWVGLLILDADVSKMSSLVRISLCGELRDPSWCLKMSHSALCQCHNITLQGATLTKCNLKYLLWVHWYSNWFNGMVSMIDTVDNMFLCLIFR